MLCPGMEEWHEEPPEELNMEPGRKEMWDFGRAATGYDDDALSSMLAHFNRADAATMLALKETLGTVRWSHAGQRTWCENSSTSCEMRSASCRWMHPLHSSARIRSGSGELSTSQRRWQVFARAPWNLAHAAHW